MSFISILEIVFQISLISSILACIIFILRPTIKKFFGFNILYFIWVLLIIKLIVPYGPESKISIYNLLNKVENSASYDDKEIHTTSKIISDTNKINTSMKNSSEIQNNIIESSIQNFKNKNQYFNIETILSAIWFIGILIFIILAVISYYNLFNIRKNMICKYNRQSLKILNNCLDLLNIKRNIEILVVNTISSPVLCGVIRPKILIPQSIFNNISDDELRYIILHELCHYKRKDVALTWVIYLLKAVYWFNPIILFALNTMKEDCEIACDNMVVSKLNKKESLYYGYTIINVLSYIGDTSMTLGTTSMISNKKRLKERIRMIGENKKSSIGKIIAGILVVLILGAITLSSGVNKIEAKTNSNVDNDLVKDISNEANANSKIEDGKDVILDIDASKMIASEGKMNSSMNVVVYNSHAEEAYKDGYSVVEAGIALSEKLNELNVNSTFLNCEPASSYRDSYRDSEKLIKENVENYSEAVLLDFHRGGAEGESDSKITIALAESSVNYEENLKLAEALSRDINNKGIKTEIFTYKKGSNNFNLHLSKKSIVMDIGNENMTEAEVNELINEVSESMITVLQ